MTSVSITHSRSKRTTMIDVDNKRLERVLSYSLTQERELTHPVVEVIAHDEHQQEYSRTFVPTILVLRTIP